MSTPGLLALQQALQAIVARHATLRSRFVLGEDQPQVLIGAIEEALELGFEDLRDAPRNLAERVRAEAAQAFDLERGDRLDDLLHLRITDDDVGAIGREAEHRTIDQLLEHFTLALHRLERARVERFAFLLTTLLTHAVEGLAEFFGADFGRGPRELAHQPPVRRGLPPFRRRLDLGGIVGIVLEQILLHAEEREGDREHRHDGDGDPTTGLISKRLQHGSGHRMASRAVYPQARDRAGAAPVRAAP